MQHPTPVDGSKPRTSRSSRSSSVGSDSIPTPIVSSLKAVPAAKPSPAYVAVAAASELVTNNRQLALEEDAYDLTSPPSPDHHDSAIFSSAGLALVNAFLDQLLYNFLFHARTTALPALRQSVEQVLKGKLAAYAIACADEELEELLNEELDEDLAAVYESASGSTKGDVEAVFWRTRLRVMVYMRLGEMEDEDEEQYVDEAQVLLQKASDQKRLSLTTGLVSWAAAIFLTSILEFVAEQCLNAAGQAAFDRVSAKRRGSKGEAAPDEEEQVVIEEHDTERVALSSTLGRLWRTWRKGLRTPHSRNISLTMSNSSSRKQSLSAARPDLPGRQYDGISLSRLAMQNSALPLRGIGASDEGARLNAARIHRISQRPRSLIIEPTKASDQKRNSRSLFPPDPLQQSSLGRSRSRSLPNPGRIAFTPVAAAQLPANDRPSTAPKPGDVTPSDANVETTPSPVHATSSAGIPSGEGEGEEEPQKAVPEQREPFDRKPVGSGEKTSNYLERAVATRKPVPNSQESTSQSSAPAESGTTEHASADSTESLTSIDEDFESQTAGSTDATEFSQTTSNGLGIHPDPTSRAFPIQLGDSTLDPPDSPPPTHVQARTPQYHDQQHVVKSVASFEREEKSSVRRLSNGSSQRSKSLSSARLPGKRSQETLASPKSAATSRSGQFEKGFGDFVAGDETVKYTLTPRTLQEIESPNSPRYKVQQTGRVTSDNRKQQQGPDQDLAAAQRAVIASMNASLRNFSSPGEKTSFAASSMSQAKSLPPVPPIPRSSVTNNWPPQTSTAPRDTASDYSGHASSTAAGQSPGTNFSRVSLNQQRSTQQATSSRGWFSARTSSETPRSAKTNGASSARSVQTQNKANALLQPREAVVGRRGENEDLISFLRSTGPPGPQLYTGPNGRSTDSYTMSSANQTSSSVTQSANGSVSSHSGLLGTNGSRGQGGRSVSGLAGGDDGAGGMPAKTRRRMKDPYALPSDDEDDEGLTALPTRGESLVEFLRNVHPPASMTAPVSPTRTMTSEAQDARLLNGVGRGGNRPTTPGSPASSKGLKGKGSVKSFWKKIGT